MTVYLRPVTPKDSAIIFDWQQNPRTRRYFNTPEPPTWNEHAAWMEKRLVDRTGNFMLVVDGETPSGVARLDQRKPGVFEVSILVDSARQGRGIGKAALLALRKLQPGAVLEADVRSENEASAALFLAVGYTRENGKYIHREPVRVVFRADASDKIGGGHVMRCLTLADALSKAGWACAFATRPQSLVVVPALAESGHGIIDLSCTAAEEPGVIADYCGGRIDWLVVDHYERDGIFETACRPRAERILVIDDLVDRPHECDLLLDQAPDRTAEDYRALTPPGCGFLLGPDYALLRPQFAEVRKAMPECGATTGGIRKILVSLGAIDAGNRTASVLRALDTAGNKAEIDIVLGPGAPHIEDVHELARSMPYKTRVHIDVKGMACLMGAADLVIGAAGTSSWERCCLGLPSLVIVTADNQQDFASALQACGAAEVVDGRKGLSVEDLAHQMQNLAENPNRLASMASAAAKICDGLGSDRVFAAMAAAEIATNKEQ